jgi:hypothetical protein
MPCSCCLAFGNEEHSKAAGAPLRLTAAFVPYVLCAHGLELGSLRRKLCLALVENGSRRLNLFKGFLKFSYQLLHRGRKEALSLGELDQLRNVGRSRELVAASIVIRKSFWPSSVSTRYVTRYSVLPGSNITFEPSLSNVSLRFPGNAIFRPETRAPKRPLKAKCLIPETKRPEYKAAKRGHFAILQEISVCMGMRGGAGRTRTSNQAVMSRHRRLGGLELATKPLSAASSEH